MAGTVNELLGNSTTWETGETRVPRIKVVTRNAPNLKSLLFKRRSLALEAVVKIPDPCGTPRCQTCTLMSGNNFLNNNEISLKTMDGDCKSTCIIYAASCIKCSNNNSFPKGAVDLL